MFPLARKILTPDAKHELKGK